MARKPIIHGVEVIDEFLAKNREFLADWLRFNQLIVAYPNANSNKAQLEHHFLQVKSKLARDQQVIRHRLGSDCKFSPDIVNIISSATTLSAIFQQSEVAVRKLQSEWHRAYITVNETIGNLEDKRRRAEQGERVSVGGLLVQTKVRKPFPWRKVLLATAATTLIVLAGGTVYVMRHFLGFWAPGAGEGIVVAKTMTDEEKIHVLVGTLQKAIENGDVDTILSAFSDSYSDAAGRGKTEARAFLQAYRIQGGFEGAKLDISAMKIQIDGDRAVVGPIHFIGPRDQGTFVSGVQREGERWLIYSGTGY